LGIGPHSSYGVFTRGDCRNDRSRDQSLRSVARPIAVAIQTCRTTLGRSGDVLPSQSLGLHAVLTQQKETHGNKMAKTQKSNLNLKNLNQESVAKKLFMCVCVSLCRPVVHNTAHYCDNLPSSLPDNQHGSNVVCWRGGGDYVLQCQVSFRER